MYTKIIQSGKLVEVYTYASDPPPYRPRKKSRFKNPRRYRRNVERARAAFFRLVRANLGSGPNPAFVTLTMREVVTLQEGWTAFTQFSERFRYNFSNRISLVAVPEFQKRGSIHFHLIVWGLNEYAKNERNSRQIQNLWQRGFVDCVQTDGSEKIAGYLAKYMRKSMYDIRLIGQKAYTASRSCLRSVSLSSSFQVRHSLEICGVDLSTLTPLQDKSFSTQWLGQGRYRLYKSNN